MSKKNDSMIKYSDYYLKNFREKSKVHYENRGYDGAEGDTYYGEPIRRGERDARNNLRDGAGDVTASVGYRVDSAGYRPEPLKLKAIIPNEIDNEPYMPMHAVEYIAPNISDNDGRKRGKKRVKKKTPKTKARNKGIVLVVLTILLCFSGTILIADTMSGGYMLDDFQAMLSGKANVIKIYYAIEMMNFTDQTSAKVYSTELRAQGAGGYIINDKLYRVIAEVYSSKEDADNVCAKLNIDGYMARLYEIEIDDIDYKLMPTSVRNITKSTMKYVGDTYSKLYAIGAKLAAKSVDKSAAVAELRTLRATIANLLTEYEGNCDNKKDDTYVYKLRLQLGAVLSGVDSLCETAESAAALLADIRYTNAMILHTHDLMCQQWSEVK